MFTACFFKRQYVSRNSCVKKKLERSNRSKFLGIYVAQFFKTNSTNKFEHIPKFFQYALTRYAHYLNVI